MEDLSLRTDLGPTFISEKKALSYPYLFIKKFGEEIALMTTCIRPGRLPILISDNGVLKQVGSCDLSALELSKLLRVYSFDIVLSETDCRTISTIPDIMEVLPWMVSSLS